MSNAFDMKRQEVLKQISTIKTNQKLKKKIESQATVTPSSSTAMSKPLVAIFGKPSIFLISIKTMMNSQSQLSVFSSTTETIDTCAEKSILNVIIDIDDTTGIKPAIEIIGNLKGIQPNTRFFCCTQNTASKDATIIEQKGATLISKPINTNLLLKQLIINRSD